MQVFGLMLTIVGITYHGHFWIGIWFILFVKIWHIAKIDSISCIPLKICNNIPYPFTFWPISLFP